MRITYLHQYFKTPQAAGGTRSYELARRLVARGHEVNVVTSDTSPKHHTSDWYHTEEAGIRVHWLPNEYSNHMPYGRRIRAFLRFATLACSKAASLPADVVFATSTPLTIAIPAVYAARRRRVPMVFEVRDLWPEAPITVGALRNPLLIHSARWLERWAYENSAQIVALSEQIAAGIRGRGYPGDRIAIIPNGASLTAMPHDHAPAVMPDGFGNRRLITYVGTLGLVNEVHRIVELARRVKEASDIAFLIVGGGREVDQVRNLAAEQGLLDRNFFMMGQLPHSSVPFVLAQSTATIATAPYAWKTYGGSLNKVADYLAAGKPIFCAFEGWLSSLVCQQGAGVYLPRDPDAAAVVLLEHIGNQEWLSGASQAARKLAETKFNFDLLVEDFEGVLEAAVQQWHHKKSSGSNRRSTRS